MLPTQVVLTRIQEEGIVPRVKLPENLKILCG
jgi:hypothetical protein